MKLTASEEKFAQGLFRGLSQRKAYYEAYPNSKKWKENTVDSRACELAKERKITGRIKQLRDRITKKSEWTVDRLIKEFEELKQKCIEHEDFKDAGACRSLENIGKLIGAYDKEESEEKPIEVIIKRRDKK